MIITSFGHSDFNKAHVFENMVLSILSEIAKDEKIEFFIGGYGSFDFFFYQCCMKFKKIHSNAKVVFVTPYITEDYQKKRLASYKNSYDEIVYPNLEKVPYRFAICHRNKWMVEQADYIIAYINHEWGGAYQAYKYAIRKGKKVFNLGRQE